LHNLYGPTEAAIDVTYFECDGAKDSPRVPIGRPIWNTQIYILDTHRQPVPLGVAGEIYIGGDAVARGYLSREELTAERFVRTPLVQMQMPGCIARVIWAAGVRTATSSTWAATTIR
jgi:non-ribosomal peptide synthetase component F